MNIVTFKNKKKSRRFRALQLMEKQLESGKQSPESTQRGVSPETWAKTKRRDIERTKAGL